MDSKQATAEAERAYTKAQRCAAGIRADLLEQIRRATALIERLDHLDDEALITDLTAHFSMRPTMAADLAALGGNIADVHHYHAIAAEEEIKEISAEAQHEETMMRWGAF